MKAFLLAAVAAAQHHSVFEKKKEKIKLPAFFFARIPPVLLSRKCPEWAHPQRGRHLLAPRVVHDHQIVRLECANWTGKALAVEWKRRPMDVASG